MLASEKRSSKRLKKSSTKSSTNPPTNEEVPNPITPATNPPITAPAGPAIAIPAPAKYGNNTSVNASPPRNVIAKSEHEPTTIPAASYGLPLSIASFARFTVSTTVIAMIVASTNLPATFAPFTSCANFSDDCIDFRNSFACLIPLAFSIDKPLHKLIICLSTTDNSSTVFLDPSRYFSVVEDSNSLSATLILCT